MSPPPLLISSTEPPRIRQLGRSTQMPENYGVDIFWVTPTGQPCGIQRKEIGDLVASLQDGRLAYEVNQMSALHTVFLIVEGRLNWSTDGQLLSQDRWSPTWNRQAHRSLLRSVASRGIIVEHTDGMDDTITTILSMVSWTTSEHLSVSTRPNPRGTWGSATDEDYAVHLLQSVPTLGPKTAKAILKHFGGVPPIAPTCTPEELLQVPGVGKDMVRRFWRAFTGGDPSWTPKVRARKAKAS